MENHNKEIIKLIIEAKGPVKLKNLLIFTDENLLERFSKKSSLVRLPSNISKLYKDKISLCEILERSELITLIKLIRLGFLSEKKLEEIENKEDEFCFSYEKWVLEMNIYNGQQAMDFLVKSNIKYVHKIAREFYNEGMDFDYLVQEGNKGLKIAAKLFDYLNYSSFSLYSTKWIKIMIMNSLENQEMNKTLPTDTLDIISAIFNVNEGLKKILNRKPNIDELYEALKIVIDLNSEENENSIKINTKNDSINNIDLISKIRDKSYLYNFSLQNIMKESCDINHIIKKFNELYSKLDRNPSLSELAKFLNMPEEKINYILKQWPNDCILANDNKKNYKKETKVVDYFKLYYNDIELYNVLSQEEEKNIFEIIQNGENLKEKIQKIENKSICNHLCYDEFMTSLIYFNGIQAKEFLLESNLRLVVKTAKNFFGKGMTIEDIIQEGNLGLLKAANKFDYTQGFKFSTYATWCIKYSIIRAVIEQRSLIHIPENIYRNKKLLDKAKADFLQEFNRTPTIEELAITLDMTVDEVKKILDVPTEVISSDSQVGDDTSVLIDSIADNSVNPLEYTENENYKVKVNLILSKLKPIHEKIMIRKLGLIENYDFTYKKIADEFDINIETAKRLSREAQKEYSKLCKEYMIEY